MVPTRAFSLFVLLSLCLSLTVAVLTPHQLLNKVKGEIKEVKSRVAKRDVDACGVTTCVSAGGSCSSDFNVCVNDTVCSEVTGRCTPYTPLGGNCTSDDDDLCKDSCLAGKCNEFGSPGDQCTNDNECAYFFNNTYVTQCIQNRCAGIPLGGACEIVGSCLPPNFCSSDICVAPYALGAACKGNSECQGEYVCNNNNCTLPAATGSACTLFSDAVCSFGDTCAPLNATGTRGICVRQFSRLEGAFCNEENICGEGLMCSSESRDTTGTCILPFSTPSYKNCSDDSDCGLGESCQCNGLNGTNQCMYHSAPTPTGISALYQQMFACLATCNNTSFEDCTKTKCSAQYCSYIQVTYRELSAFFLANEPKCIYDDFLLSVNNLNLGFSCNILGTTTGASTGSVPATSGSAGTTRPATSNSAATGTSGQPSTTDNTSAGTRTAYACATVFAFAFLLAM